MSFYGVDENGMPDVPGGVEMTGSGGGCPSGQEFNEATGTCVQKAVQTVAQPAANNNVPAPGNDANQINGWTTQWLGRNFTPQDITDLNGQPLDLVMHNIANSPEALAYAASKNKPAASGAAAQGPASNSQALVPGGPSTPSPASYQFTPYVNSVAPFDPFKFTPAATYAPDATQNTTRDLLQKLLTSTSMGPDIVSMMKEGQKGTILDGASQLRQGILRDAARRGVAGGGNTEGLINANNLDALGKISAAYRGIDTNAATQNRTDQTNAVGLGTNFQAMLFDQFLKGEQERLATESAQSGANTSAEQLTQGRSQNAFGQYATTEAMKKASSDAAFQQWLASQGLNLDFVKTAVGANQFDNTQQMILAKWLAGN